MGAGEGGLQSPVQRLSCVVVLGQLTSLSGLRLSDFLRSTPINEYNQPTSTKDAKFLSDVLLLFEFFRFIIFEQGLEAMISVKVTTFH